MISHYIKQWLLSVFLALWLPLLAPAQEIGSLSPSALPFGAYVTGLYHIEEDAGGLYLKEETDGTLTAAAPDTTDSCFYFWLVENVYENYFQLYSATRQGKLLQINTDGTAQWTTDPGEETSKLLFRMYPAGPARDTTNTADGVAMGYITTKALAANYGNADCGCNFLTVSGNSRFRIHDSGIRGDNYRPVVFEKTDDANGLGTVDTQNNITRINQGLTQFGFPQNFISSNFFVKDFGEDDFRITIDPGTEGYIGFLEYTDHHYTREVYQAARSKIGLKIANNQISLIYLSGDQTLPSGSLSREVVTDFVLGTPFTMGFKGQDSLIVSQNGSRYGLGRAAPAELFFNRSVTQSARMLVQLVQGGAELSYTTKNYLINSEDDLGTDDGSDFVSTHAFFPYNGGDPLVNTFDWQQTQWPVRYVGSAGTVDDLVFSPFYSSSTEFSGITARYDLSGDYIGGEDFSASEGWELIKADLGYNADGTARPQAPVHPYVIFYDRVSGTMRVFVYTNNEGEANQLNVSLSVMGGTPANSQGYVPKLWGSLQQFSALDEVKNNRYGRVLPFYSASGRSWYFADFVMEYDPCIAFFESTINLIVEKTTQGDLTMIGRLEGGSIPAGTTPYDDWKNQREDFLMGVMDNNFGSLQNTLGDITFSQYGEFDVEKFQDSIGGLLTGAEIEDWEKEKARIEWEAQKTIGYASIAEGAATIAGGAAQAAGSPLEGVPFVSGVSEAVQGISAIAAGAAQITAGEAELRLASANKLYYDAIKDKVREDDQAITMAVPPPRPQVVFGELALKGTLSIQTTLIPEAFTATPGGKGSNNAPEWYVNGSRGSKPLYNRPLGKFALLKQPQFAIGVAKNENSPNYKAWLKINEKPYFAHNNTAIGKIDDVLSLSIQVQTLDTVGKVVHHVSGKAYTNLFGVQNGNPLPGEMDISNLINWDQINVNISGLADQSPEHIASQLGNWIRVSYEVWSLTLTTLKSRNLDRVFANGDQYYDGKSSFAYTTATSFGDQLLQVAKAKVVNDFAAYNFSDDANFGNAYSLYHTQYDGTGDAFYTAMNSYCTALNNAQNPQSKNGENIQDIKGGEAAEEEPAPEEFTVLEPGLTVYPNPVHHRLNFRLVSQQTGKAGITLYDLTGRVLIGTTDYLDGINILQGNVNIAPLPAGIYILEAKLPDGKSISKKIVKQ